VSAADYTTGEGLSPRPVGWKTAEKTFRGRDSFGNRIPPLQVRAANGRPSRVAKPVVARPTIPQMRLTG